jgi:hypothetical protein
MKKDFITLHGVNGGEIFIRYYSIISVCRPDTATHIATYAGDYAVKETPEQIQGLIDEAKAMEKS